MPHRDLASFFMNSLAHDRDRTPFSGPLLVMGSCLDSISQGFQRFGWGAVPQRAVRSLVVVVLPPVRDQDFRFVQGREELQVQELVAQASVEALVETVLPRRARLDEQGPYSTGRQEAPGGVGDELRAVIATDEPRRPMDGHEP